MLSEKSLAVTVSGTALLTDGSISKPPIYSATTCSVPYGISDAGTVMLPEELNLETFSTTRLPNTVPFA